MAWDGRRERKRVCVKCVCVGSFPPTTLFATNTCVLQKIMVQLNGWCDFCNISSLQQFKKLFFSSDSVASFAFHHIKPKLPKILWYFLWCYCCADATIFFRERDKLVLGYYITDAQPYNLKRKKNSSSLWMIYFFFLSLSLLCLLCSHIWKIFHWIFIL